MRTINKQISMLSAEYAESTARKHALDVGSKYAEALGDVAYIMSELRTCAKITEQGFDADERVLSLFRQLKQ